MELTLSGSETIAHQLIPLEDQLEGLASSAGLGDSDEHDRGEGQSEDGLWKSEQRKLNSNADADTDAEENDAIPPTATASSSSRRNKWIALACGQSIALIASSMNASSYTLSFKYNVNSQFFQLFLMYILLSFHFVFRKGFPEGDEATPSYKVPFTSSTSLRIPWWTYLLMSVLDVFPNLLSLWSFRYTSLTSMTLLGSLAAPATMLFSRFILSRRFGLYNIFGVLLCIVGGSLTVWADVDSSSSSSDSSGNDQHPHSYIGDIMAVAAAFMYGLGDTVAEYAVKHVDRFEYLGMLGIFGAMFTGIAFPILESSALTEVYDMPFGERLQVSAVMAWYVFSVFLYYVTEAWFLVTSDATLLNLCMQTSNLWAILFSLIAYNDAPPILFYPALLLVVVGVFVYELGGVQNPIEHNNEERRANDARPREPKQSERAPLSNVVADHGSTLV